MGYCIDRIYFGGEALCIHNAATGREATMPHEVSRSEGPSRKVVVVGAGPAGLEAARVAAARGHRVVLFEAAAEAGGQVRLTAQLKRRREIIGIVDWRLDQCAKHGRRAAPQYLRGKGRRPRRGRPTSSSSRQAACRTPPSSTLARTSSTTSWDILSGAAKPAETVLLYDDNGAHPGMTAAEFIADAGSRLEIVTPERVLAPEVGGTNYPAYFRRLSEADARITLNLRLERVAREGNELVAQFFNDYSRRTRAASGAANRGRARHFAERGAVSRAEAAIPQSRRDRL